MKITVNTLKRALPYLTAIVVFLVIAVGYCSPALFQKKTLNQYDIRKGIASSVDVVEYQKETGEKSLWASRMFSGMPAYQIAPTYKTSAVQTQLRNAYELWLPSPANHLFAYMLGFFLLLLALRVNPWIAIVGAIAFAFSSYFLIIITAGHIWKVRVLTLIAPTMAGIIWTYRGKYLWGAAVTALFFSLQLFSNHLQMTFYFLMFVGVYFIGHLAYDFKQKQLAQFAKATAILVVVGIIAVGANATNLIFTEKYTAQTIRGKSELSTNSEDKTGGLDRSYATGWSYGIGETFTLLIPDTKGGATGAIADLHPEALKKSDQQFRDAIAGQNSYWGDQPMTSGPVYAGAFIMFLFILGLFYVRGYMKWALLIGTVLSIMLAWGSNFMWFTNLFLDYFPYYNKMRTVSSILVVAQLCIPILAILALVKVVENPSIIREKKFEFYMSLGLTAGLILVFLVMPKVFFSFLSRQEAGMFNQLIQKEAIYSSFRDSLVDVRVSIFRSDAGRSLLVILLGVGGLLMYSYKIFGKALLISLLGVIVLFDMSLVDKRYLNNQNFVSKTQTKVTWEMTPADATILEAGKDNPNYRVLNLSVSPFNDASTSYYHKSIGGYHGAKLRRYQDIIDHYINFDPQKGNVNPSVLNMLNTRYIISQEGQVQENPAALGSAWFVDKVQLVENADEEIAALEGLNPATNAVIDKRFSSAKFQGALAQTDSTASIVLEKYRINDITYKTKSATEQLAVFSEIYYDDGLSRWEAFVDGQVVPIIRANYILRALQVPAGEHTIEFVFKPKAYDKLESTSTICLAILLVGVVGLPAIAIIRKRKKSAESKQA